MKSFLYRWLLLGVVIGTLTGFVPLVQGQQAFREGFEAPEATWQEAGSDVAHRIVAHARVGEPHGGIRCEYLDVLADNGSYLHFSHDVPQAMLIVELAPSLWIKADRNGLQLMVRAVLPRTKDPKTGAPLTTLLRGPGYTQSPRWQQLKFGNLPRIIDQQIPALRAQYGSQVDAREAYIDRVVLNIYGGAGRTQVWIDDLEVNGLVSRESLFLPASASVKEQPGENSPLPERLPETAKEPDGRSDGFPEVRLKGNILQVAGKPFFPRMVAHHGEELADLKQLGFNCIRLSSPPTPQILSDATRQGMWIVAPPPGSLELEALRTASASKKLDASFDPVIAWDLGEGLSTRESDANRRWSKSIRAVDARSRPLLCGPDSDLLAYSRHVDLLCADRFPVGGSFALSDYGAWLRERPQLARPGTPFWTTVQTQSAPAVTQQAALLSGRTSNANLQDAQVRSLLYSALSAGVRGIAFQSQSSLAARDPQTQVRAALLELLNMELELLQPWTATGGFLTVASSNDPSVIGCVLQMERARLVLPLTIAPNSQYVAGAASEKALGFTVPGASESSDAYELTPAGLRPLPHRRVTGGIRVALEDGTPCLIVLTQDPQVISSLSRRLNKTARRAAQLQRLLAASSLEQTEQINERLSQQARSIGVAQTGIAAARAMLTQCDELLGRGEFRASYLQSGRCLEALRRIQRSYWEQAAKDVAATTSDPTLSSFATLGEHWQLASLWTAEGKWPNRLLGGDFEDMKAMLNAGWRHYQHVQDGIATGVEFSPESPHAGQFALRLKAAATQAQEGPVVVETPPVWITSAPVRVEEGSKVHIQGWVRVPAAIVGSLDKLLIMDSLGGEVLALRVGQTSGWQQFNLYRAAPRSGAMTITFALAGLGEAWLDDVTVKTVEARPSEMAASVPRP